MGLRRSSFVACVLCHGYATLACQHGCSMGIRGGLYPVIVAQASRRTD